MPRYVVERIADALNSQVRAINGSRVHLFGVAYKSGVSDVRESPAIDIALLLQERAAVLSYSDPYVPHLSEKTLALEAIDQETALTEGIDCAVITTDHRGFDYADIARRAPVVVDTRNALKDIDAGNIFKL